MSITRHEAIQMILAEVDRAYSLHPVWPKDRIHQSAIVLKEAGELVESSLHAHYEPHKGGNAIKEAVQLAAMAIRFLEATP